MNRAIKTTPRPWFIRRYNGDLTIQGRRGKTTVAILLPCQLEDARLMLRAVNSYRVRQKERRGA